MLVRKYSNRRLYDTTSSRYVTLEEIADQVRAGADLQVVDAGSGEDLTQPTLAQIILESRGAARLLPSPLLIQLIRMGDDALAEFFGRYVTAALELYLHARQGAQALAPYNPFATLPFTATNAIARLVSALNPWAEPPRPPQSPYYASYPPPPPSPSPPPPPSASPSPPPPPDEPAHSTATAAAAAGDVAALRRELDDLRRELRRRKR